MASNLTNTLLELIAHELHVVVEELQDDDTEFLELGMNPILAQSIVKRILQTTGLKLSEDIFERFPSVGLLKQHIATTWAFGETKEDPENSRATPYQNKVLSFLIQGNRDKATKNVFLLPDGSGSAMAYARLPAMSATCIYALNSPFLQETNGYSFSIEHLASIWAQEIERIQPQGPYILGGWSAGGYYAYEIMKRFHQQGKIVEKLIIIDSPCRTDFEAVPMELIWHLSSNNLMGNWAETPRWLIDHFEATLKAVEKYRPIKIVEKFELPDVFIIWASDALLSQEAAAKTDLDLQVKVSRCLLMGHTDFGPNGWDKLLPGARMAIAKVSGNHFSIIHPPNIEALGSLLRDAVQDKKEEWINGWQRVII